MRVLGISILAGICTLARGFTLLPTYERGLLRGAPMRAEMEMRPAKRGRKHQSGYIQDPRDDRITIEPDAATVYRLLEDRAKARREQDWKRADRILEQLQKDHGILVYDGHVRVYSRQGSAPLNVLKERYQKHYGPNSHPYTHVGPQELDPIICPLTMNDVHNALCRRLWLKSEKRYFEADAQLYELMTYGIEVNDGLKQWRSDGKVSFAKEWSKPPTRALTYKEITSLELPERTRVRITQLIKQRANAVARVDTNLADMLQYELRMTYTVIINDFDQTWQVNHEDTNTPKLVEATPPFKMQSTSHLPTLAALDPEHNWAMGGPYRYNEIVSAGKELSAPQEARVMHLLMQRDELRSIGHFIEADSVVDEIWNSYQVDPHDTRRQFSVGQKFDDYDERVATPPAAQPQRVAVVKERIDYDSTSEEDVPRWWELYEESGVENGLGPGKSSEVENLIKYLATQQQRNPNIVDRLMVRLEEEYGLLFDGTTWKLKGKIQQYTPVTSVNISSAELLKIQELVNKRNEEMFQLKNKSMAEILEAGLQSKYNIVINDETQSWYLSE